MSARQSSEAQRHLAALERLDRMIAAFASMMSHQTRSALVGIQGLSELIRDGDLTATEVRAFASDIFGEALKIDAMIGEMFDLNLLETQESPLRKARVDMDRIVAEEAAKVGLLVESRPGRRVISGDRDRLKQALQCVFAFVQRSALPGSRISVTVARQGNDALVSIGSSASKSVEFEDWLYGRYERYEQRPSTILGAGLGLAVARAIVELHGGTIEARPAGDAGAEFRLTLPALAASPEAPALVPAPTPSQ